MRATVHDSIPDVGIVIDNMAFDCLMHDAIHNAEIHSAKDSEVLVEMEVLKKAEAGQQVCIKVVNAAGEHHQQMLDLQDEHGDNFLVQMNRDLVATSPQHRGFLGIHEEVALSEVLGADFKIHFEDRSVTTTVTFTAPISINPTKSEEGEGGVTMAEGAEPQSPPQEPLMYFCDDDQAPRAFATRLITRLPAQPDSLVKGEDYAGVAAIPGLVLEAAGRIGDENIVCVFDRNMHWQDGSIDGSAMMEDLRKAGFQGVIAMRTANDDPETSQGYLDNGADAVLSKAMPLSTTMAAIRELIKKRPWYTRQVSIGNT